MQPQQSVYEEKLRPEVYPFLPADAVRYLDVGCGSGGFGRTVIAHNGPGARLVGIEPVPEAAARARLAGYERVLEGFFPDVLDSDPESFDCIVFNDVLEHMVDPWSAVAASRRFLAPGGAVVASIPSIRYLPVLYRLLKGRWDYEDCGTLDRTHLRFFTKATMVEMFEEAGFLVERVQGVNNDWDFPRWRRLKRFAFLTGDFQWLQFVLVCRPAGGSGESAE
ncbi:MAG TPA: class I SAM-dependent methyltransferase [Dermatophilaceae bacterium]|nr:class I SAM-dependent methyltransferase [Dermatophilaceae bacterium]